MQNIEVFRKIIRAQQGNEPAVLSESATLMQECSQSKRRMTTSEFTSKNEHLRLPRIVSEKNVNQADESTATMPKVGDKSASVITVALQRLDERLTVIQNMAELKVGQRSVDERFDKFAAEFRSLNIKTKSMDAKLVVADRKHEQTYGQVSSVAEAIRELREQVRSPLRIVDFFNTCIFLQ